MAYEIELTTAALRDLRALAPAVLQRIDARIRALAEQPRPPGVEKLTDREGLYRIRVRDYRILYEVDDARQVVTVVRVRDRRESYRR
ncbi:MAG: type II toxin-antitoxin system RelE family toxin [Candidatus Entotheonellia bacterium]